MGDSTDPLEWGRIAWGEIDHEAELDGLLEAEGVHEDKVKKNFLPLEAFIDPEQDLHDPHGWLATADPEAGLLAVTPMYNIKQVCTILRARLGDIHSTSIQQHQITVWS